MAQGRPIIATCARHSSAKLPRCGMIELHVGILARHELDRANFADRVVEHRHPELRAASQISRVIRAS